LLASLGPSDMMPPVPIADKKFADAPLPAEASAATGPQNGSAAQATPPAAPLRYAALDFETADYGRDSACALSIVVVEDHKIVSTWTSLIRPPRRSFVFTYLHGIGWEHVKGKPRFGELWEEIKRALEGVSFIAAHNASFDRSVLRACCETAGLEPVRLPFVCTVKASRSAWGFYPTTLADVCRHLEIPLRHHDAESDAQACARIVMTIRQRVPEHESVLKRCTLKPSRPKAAATSRRGW
jgi:DNA polymerase III subunit epsilon